MQRAIGVAWPPEQGYLPGSVPQLFQQMEDLLRAMGPVEQLPYDLGYHEERGRLKRWQQLFAASRVVVVPCTFAGEALRRRRQLGVNVPIVYLPLGELPRGARGLREYHGLFRAGDVIAFSSPADEALFHTLVAATPARLIQLPFGVRTDRFRQRHPAERAVTRAKLEIPESAVVVTYLGRVTAAKNVHGLVRAMVPVLEAHPGCHLVIAGPLEDEHFLDFGTGPFPLEPLLGEPLRGREALADRVHVLSRLTADESAELLGASDVFANLTLHGDENFGFTQVEAMAAGLPVVATRWGGLKGTLVEGKTALTVDTCVARGCVWADLVQASRSLGRLVADGALRKRLGAAGRKRALAHYSTEAFSRGLKASIAATRRTRAGAGKARLTRFGAAYDRRFRKERRARWPLYTPETYALYEALIAGYASRAAPGPLAPGDTLFIAPLTLRVGRRAEMVDPLWPRSVEVSAGERRALTVLLALVAREGAAYVSLQAALSALGEQRAFAREEDGRAVLSQLIERGLLFRSPAPA